MKSRSKTYSQAGDLVSLSLLFHVKEIIEFTSPNQLCILL